MELHSIVKPWLFKVWAMELIGKIYPASSKGHSFILVVTDYFAKWVEGLPLKKVEQKDVIQFIKEQIIHRFGILHSITTDQGTMSTSDEMTYFSKDYDVRLIKSTIFLFPSKWQIKSSNKVLINILEKMLKDNHRDCHIILSETL